MGFSGEPLRSVWIQLGGQFHENTCIPRGNGPIQECVVLPLFLEAAKPLHPLR